MTDELLDRGGHAEEVPDDIGEPFGIPDLTDERPDVKELRRIGQRVAIAERRRRQPGECADVGREAVVVRAVAIDMRLRLRPRALEQREHPVVKQIEEPAERRIAGVALALARVFGDVRRQRTVRAEESEQPDLQPRRRAVVAGLERREGSGRKGEVGILSEAYRLVGRAQRAAPPRLVLVQAFEPAQRLVEIVAVRRVRHGAEKGYSVGLAPHCGTHLLISPRVSDDRTVSVNEFTEA